MVCPISRIKLNLARHLATQFYQDYCLPLLRFKPFFLDCRGLDLVLGSQLVSIGAVRSQKFRAMLYGLISQLNLHFKSWIVDVDPALSGFGRVVLCSNCMLRDLKV